MRTCVILNPAAGASQKSDALRERLRSCRDCRLLETRGAGDGDKLARAALEEGCTRIIAAGGDGTINEAVNGMGGDFDAADLAIVPLGTGNDLARTLGLPDSIPEALELALTGRARRIDVGVFRGRRCSAARHFVNVAAGGFAGLVNQRLTAENKQDWGSLAYIASALAAWKDVPVYRFTLSVAGQSMQVDAYNAVVANGRFAAGGIPVAPQAMLDDGRLEVAILPARPLAESALAALQVILGRQNESERIITFQARELRIESTPDMPFNVDGELQGECDARFEVLPKALSIVAGENCEAFSQAQSARTHKP